MDSIFGLSLYVIFSLWSMYLIGSHSLNEFRVHNFEGAKRNKHAAVPTALAILCIATFVCLVLGV